MTGRERLFAALNGEETDHVPVWLLFPYSKTSYYADVKNLPRWRSVYKASQEKAITLNRRNLGAPLFAPEVEVSHIELEENGSKVSRTIYEWRDVKLQAETRISQGETKVKKLLDNEEDLEAYCRLPILADEESITRHLDAQLERYLKERDEFPLELGAMMLDLGEPIGPLYANSNLEEFAVWSLTRSEMVEELLARVMERQRMIYEYCLERDLADVYFLVGSELAAPPLVGVETFQKWIVPLAKELTEKVHAKGRKVIQHFHGQIKALLPYFVEMGADALHTIEAPPIGNCLMEEAFEITGGKMALIGNIQYDDFHRWSPERMREETLKLLEACRGKRLILSPSAGPFEADPPEAVLRNYESFLEAAWGFR